MFTKSSVLFAWSDHTNSVQKTFLRIEKGNKMADKPVRNNIHCTIPDDPDQSTYRFIIVAAKRARQLQGGARPVLPTSSKKPTVIAIEEVRRGLVKYTLTGRAPGILRSEPEV